MANFTEAYKLTSAHEGGYVNDAVDRGGETYRGISRVHHPGWDGWSKIDALKRRSGFPGNLKSDRSLQASVKSFYKKKYWDRFKGDDIPDQDVANELYDTGVNMGMRRVIRFLQNGLNLLNRNQKNYQDLVVDGLFGAKTLGILEKHLRQETNANALLKLLNIQQGERYVTIMENDRTQEKFARGWLKRT
jgi:lysozyme family protein